MVSSEIDTEERLQVCPRKIQLKRNLNDEEKKVSNLEETVAQVDEMTKVKIMGSRMKKSKSVRQGYN